MTSEVDSQSLALLLLTGIRFGVISSVFSEAILGLKFQCNKCGHIGTATLTTDKDVPFILAPWYSDSKRLKHDCIYCRSCGMVHDTIGSLLHLKKLIRRQIPSDIINTYEIPDYKSLVLRRTPPFDSLHPYILIAMQQDGRTTQLFAPHFFELPVAVSLMGKSVNEVLDRCVVFNPKLLPKNDPAFDSLMKENPELLNRLKKFKGTNFYDEECERLFNEYERQIDATVGFHCYLKIEDYEAFSFIGVNFVKGIAVECFVSLGKPINTERYSLEYEVSKTVTHSLEGLYHNGRVQQDDQNGRAYTWKEGSSLISFVSFKPLSPDDKVVRLHIQIRNIPIHPQKELFELLYNEAKKSVPKYRL